MYNPVSTYRIQFNRYFTFNNFESLADYFITLGIKCIYASPIFSAVPGSMHGYDIINPNKINAEIGDIDELNKITENLQQEGVGWLQDIVPNHMAFHPANDWLMDFLKENNNSSFNDLFDKFSDEKIMVPFLENSLEEEVENKNVQLIHENGNFFVNCYQTHIFPVNKISSDFIRDLPHITEKENYKRTEWINTNPELLLQILEKQYYRLCEWRETDFKINYRRFFTINGLICLNIQYENNFELTHSLVKQLTTDKIIQGLRVDHIDGLYDPVNYLHRLRELAGNSTYIIVEKILSETEQIPGNWPVQGNTGYDFVNLANNIFTNKDNTSCFQTFYREFTGIKKSSLVRVRESKRFILFTHMNGELDNMTDLFLNIKGNNSFDRSTVKHVISEILIGFPVYRIYDNSFPLKEETKSILENIFSEIENKDPKAKTIVEQLRSQLITNTIDNENKNVLHFLKRLMQLTGPLTAKGFEDTFLYSDSTFISHNEVGSSLNIPAINIPEFHEIMKERQRVLNLSLNATSTHDTKRGEDMRARLNVLSEIPDKWFKKVHEWNNLNESNKKNNIPDRNEEYFIYQTILGSMPLEEDKSWIERLCEYLIKSLREAKIHSSWNKPDKEYEKSTVEFSKKILETGSSFHKSISEFKDLIAYQGIINSLSQTVLKVTSPGIPDFYQGCELWDFRFVDPDNRTKPDFEKRIKFLRELNGNCDPQALLKEYQNGKIKLWVIKKLLAERNSNENIFTNGEYVPLQTGGKYADHIIAFARKYNKDYFVTLLQRCSFHINDSGDWVDTYVILPEKNWINIFTGKCISGNQKFSIKELFTTLPFCCLKNSTTPKRRAGILMHITSLPSRFYTGDLGKEAYSFARFLKRSNQSIWQILPINPVTQENDFSPYSSISSRAGNIMLINPDKLVDMGLLHSDDADDRNIIISGKDTFEKSIKIRTVLLEKAWINYNNNKQNLESEFIKFCNNEKEWLDDFALFVTLKIKNGNKPWMEWNDDEKQKDPNTLNSIRENSKEIIQKIKFYQYLFFSQWEELKAYCNSLGIKIFGDMPFYLSYDSCDVWLHKEYFSLDKNGHMSFVAGTPPDYFTMEGQLWGMPTYYWPKLKENNYDWWIKRIKHNFRLYDLLRIDHFRAFAEYWEVPVDEMNAKNGKWITGPGLDFFMQLEKELGRPEIIAEDLGDNMQKVYDLRDAVKLPGMKVLLFAFGENNAFSVDLPHNHSIASVVYTGTHDNNTVKGWFETEATTKDIEKLKQYTGREVNSENVNDIFIRLAYASPAAIAIVPLQDILGLGKESRFNYPGKNKNNWRWQLKDKLNLFVEEYLKGLTMTFDR
jgi:malto-oligosyltrehalose synthase/4-alpha-glucanotransferase